MRLRILPSLLLEVRVAKGMRLREIHDFLATNEAWIETNFPKMQEYAARLPHYTFEKGQSFLYLGQELTLDFAEVPRVEVRASKLLCPTGDEGDPTRLREIIREYYRQEAEGLLWERAFHITKRMGLEPRRIRLRDLKTRWGSCSAGGDVSLNWRLMAAPISVIDYVIIHEYSHLVHMNHSKAFWNLVAIYCPNWKVERKWLRDKSLCFDFLEKKSELHY